MKASVWLCCLLVVSASACAPSVIRGHAGAAFVRVQGQTGLANSSGTPSPGAVQNDLEDSLDVADDHVSPYVRGEVGWSRHRATLSAFRYEDEGRSFLANDFGDIPAGTAVNSSLEFFNVKGAWSYDVLAIEPFRLAPGVELNYSWMDFDVAAQSSSAFESLQVDGFVPMLFLQGEVDLGIVDGVLDVAWMDADLGDTDGAYWDIEALVLVEPVQHLELFAGYRFMTLELEGDADGRDFDSDVQVSGIVLGGGVRF